MFNEQVLVLRMSFCQLRISRQKCIFVFIVIFTIVLSYLTIIKLVVMKSVYSNVCVTTSFNTNRTRVGSKHRENFLSLHLSSKNGTQKPNQECNCEPYHFDPARKVYENFVSLVDPVSGLSTGQSLSLHHPNLAVELLSSARKLCGLMPDVFDIYWRGVHWQGFDDDDTDESYLLYSTFFDNRTSIDPVEGSIRMLVFLKRFSEKLPWCHLWYDGQTNPVPSEVLRMDMLDWQPRDPTKLRTYLLTCAVRYNAKQKRGIVPIAVSLVSKPCEKSTNVLKVFGKPIREVSHLNVAASRRKGSASDPEWKVAICGPALYYVQEDFSIRIVEWLELLKTLGVSQVFLYVTQGVHPNITKVLLYYEKQGFVELVDFHFPPPLMDDALLRKMWKFVQNTVMFSMENIYFTDCVLRFKDRYRFIAHFDPDELPVLLKHNSLPEMMYDLTNKYSRGPKPPPGYKLFWTLFPLHSSSLVNTLGTTNYNHTLPIDNLIKQESSLHGTSQSHGNDLMKYLTILRSTRQLVEDNKPLHNNHKTIYDTHYVTGVGSHGTSHCTYGSCPKQTSHSVPKDVAVTGHFRDPCDERCRNPFYTRDVPRVYKHRDDVLIKIAAVLKDLDLITH